ncbi:hypothetical protein WMY93_000007 [Mugilogobius chulae]|uniref:CCHC-type domain-containing protein n=1 Tax=Mugilogobius chulae TaxID=88201 RepID=A0AAW0Q3U9_9GOBI
MMELENLRDQVTAVLCQISKDQLIEVCNLLKCQTEREGSFGDMSRRELMKVIEQKLDEVEKSYKPEDAVQYVKELLSALSGMGAKGDSGEWRDFSRASEAWDKCKELRGEIRALEEKLKMADAAPAQAQSPAPAKISEVTIRREFRISGQIGEGGQRDRLSHTNLLHQIENGLRKGHSESEVVEAVIRAISPGLKLRDMLEIKTDLTLTQLKTILKGHYREDDTSDLYQKLISISQDPKESPQDFLFRAIELKDRLLYISKGKEEEHYGADLVKKKFLRGTSCQPTDHPSSSQRKPQTSSSSTEVQALVSELKAEVAEVKQMVLASLNNNKPQSTRRPTDSVGPRRKRGCKTCQLNGEGDNCTHCFKCGQSGHISRGCRAPRLLQGNDRGPLPRDQQ